MVVNAPESLKGNCFVSFTYRNLSGLEALLSSLPTRAHPILFQRPRLGHDTLVSNGIVPTIQRCDALAYVKNTQDGDYGLSFWQKFERDYALRTSIPVFGFDADSSEFSLDSSTPLDPFVIVMCPEEDGNLKKQAKQILQFMAEQRNCTSHFNSDMTSFERTLKKFLPDANTSGVVVLLFTSGGTNSESLFDSIQTLRMHSIYCGLPVLTVIANCDPAGKPPLFRNHLYINLTKVTDSATAERVVSGLSDTICNQVDETRLAQFLDGIDDETHNGLPYGINVHRVDDVIVSLIGFANSPNAFRAESVDSLVDGRHAFYTSDELDLRHQLKLPIVIEKVLRDPGQQKLYDSLRFEWEELYDGRGHYQRAENLYQQARAHWKLTKEVDRLVRESRRIVWPQMSTRQLCRIAKQFCNAARRTSSGESQMLYNDAHFIFRTVNGRGGIPNAYREIALEADANAS